MSFETFFVLLDMFVVAWKMSVEWLPILFLSARTNFRCFHAGDRAVNLTA